MEQEQLQRIVEDISDVYFSLPFMHTARFNKRLRTTGGRYLLQSHDIEINPKYLEEQGNETLEGIIKHELCHYHLHLLGKGYKHRDKDFKLLLKKVGAPRYCKPLETNQRRKESYKYLYKCNSCNHTYKRKRRMNISRYVCGKCRGKLVEIE